MSIVITPVQVTNSTVRGRDHRDIPIRDYRPADGGDERSPLLWIHGGGFISGGLDQRESDAVARAIAGSGRLVRTVDYRLVPRFPLGRKGSFKLSDNRFPAAADDVSDAFADLQAVTGSPAAIGGASAGACLAAGTMLRIRDAGAALPVCAVLAYGTFHAALPPLSTELRSRTRGIRGFIQFSPTVVHNMNLNYVGAADELANPYALPGAGPLAGLPPVLLIDADRDTLRASGERFAEELTTAGVTSRHLVIENSRHGFLDRPRSRGFAEGLRLICGWLEQQDVGLSPDSSVDH